MTARDPSSPDLRPAYAGAAAILSGVGLARFAYVPLFPGMVAAGWVTGGEAGSLGAANLAGYLAGVVGGRALARAVSTPSALDGAMLLAVGSAAACAWNGGGAWLGLWRTLAGLAGGLLMALVGPAVQASVAPVLRGRATGIVLCGPGLGVVAGALGVPALLSIGVGATWLGLAAVSFALWIFARAHWPGAPVEFVRGTPARASAGPLYLAYGLAGAGMVPHFVYFVDLAVRGRGLDPVLGGAVWGLFGVGGVMGPLVAGRAVDRFGAVRCLQLWIGVQTIGIGLAVLPGTGWLAPAALLGAFGNIGLSVLALARAREIAARDAGLVWVRATAVFAVAQAVTGFGLAWLFAHTGSHEILFAAGLALSAAGLVASLLKA